VRSRRTLPLIFLAILLFAIPAAFCAGERTYCKAEHTLPAKVAVQEQEAGAVSFDVCNLVDFGMFPWMRYSFVSGIASLLAAGLSWTADKRARGRATVSL